MPLRRLTWTTYLLMVCQGYLFYAVGYITPYVQSELGAPAWAAAVPNSAMAVGMLVAGVIGSRLVRRIGARGAIRLWAVLMAAAGILMAAALSIWPVIAGAFLCGLATAGILVHMITALADRRDGVLLMRAALFSVVGGVVGPIVLSAASRTIGWSLGALAPVPFLLLLALVVPGAPARDTAVRAGADESPLGRPYWLAWAFLGLSAAAESSFVAWGAQVSVAQAGLTLADATALASLFVAGELVGRFALSTGLGSGRPMRAMLGGCVALTAVGGGILWLAGVPAGAGAGMFLGGLGLAAVFPIATRLAVAHAPHAPVKASARLTVAAGIAFFSAPLLLGAVASVSGVLTAWVLVLGMLLAATVVLVVIPRPNVAAAPAAA